MFLSMIASNEAKLFEILFIIYKQSSLYNIYFFSILFWFFLHLNTRYSVLNSTRLPFRFLIHIYSLFYDLSVPHPFLIEFLIIEYSIYSWIDLNSSLRNVNAVNFVDGVTI